MSKYLRVVSWVSLQQEGDLLINTLNGISPWLVFHKQVNNPVFRIFCFSYAGGGASVFRQWADHLPENIDLIAIQLPGRESRINEAPIQNLAEIIARLTSESSCLLDVDFAVFGHSLGAILSYEWIKHLKKQGFQAPRFYIPAGRKAPQVAYTDDHLHTLPENEFIVKLIKKYPKTLSRTLQNRELCKLFLPLLRADFSIAETYTYKNDFKIDCPIIALAGESELEIKDGDLSPWSELTNKHFSFRRFPGDHFFIQDSEAALLEFISSQVRQYT